MITKKNILTVLISIIVCLQSHSQSDNSLSIKMNISGESIDRHIGFMQGILKLDLYNYKGYDSIYLFLIPANESSINLKDSLLTNSIPCLLEKKNNNFKFILNIKKDFNFLKNNKNNITFFANDTVNLKLNNKDYSFYININDTNKYNYYHNFPNKKSIFKSVICNNNTFLRFTSLNRKTGIFDFANKNFWLVASDANFNGNYNDIGIDRIGIRSKQTSPNFQIGMVEYQPNIFYSLDENMQLILEKLSSNGENYLTKIQDENSAFEFAMTRKKELKIVDTMANFKFTLLNDSLIFLKECFGNKPYLLIYQWGLWCSGCFSETNFLLENYNALDKEMNIIGFNYQDIVKSEVRDYVSAKKTPWLMAYSDSLIYKNIFQSMGFPSAILIKKDMTIEKYFSQTFYLKDFLKREKPSTLIKK